MVTSCETELFPAASYALHWIWCAPEETFFRFHDVVNGADVELLMSFPSPYSSTRLTPTLSETLTETFTELRTVFPCAGDVIETVGATVSATGGGGGGVGGGAEVFLAKATARFAFTRP